MEKKTVKPWASLDKVVLPPKQKDPRVDGAVQEAPVHKTTLKDLPKLPIEVDWDPTPSPLTHLKPVHTPKNTPTKIGLGRIESRFVPPPPVAPRQPLKPPHKPIETPSQVHPVQQVSTPVPQSLPPSSGSSNTGVDIRIGDTRVQFGRKTWGQKILPWLLPIIVSIAGMIGSAFVTRYELIKADYVWRAKTEESIKVLSGVVSAHKERTNADTAELFKVVNDLDRNRVPVLERRVSSVEGLVNIPEEKLKK